MNINIDSVINRFDRMLRTVAAPSTISASRPYPGAAARTVSKGVEIAPQVQASAIEATLTTEERKHAAGLMRVNHAGEIAAQALYDGQALLARDPAWRASLNRAGEEERDHLVWTTQRLAELGENPSALSPFWYFGAFAMGAASAALGDAASKSFLKATEDQVEAHLSGHLARLPEHDVRSRAIVAAMRDDEAAHAERAVAYGAVDPPRMIRALMAATAKVMTFTAYRL